MSYRVLIAEDEFLIREGIANIIDWDKLGLEISYKAQNGLEALDMMRKDAADIVITDISMPRMNGLDFIWELRKENQRTRCIILTGFDEFDYARQAIRLDVENYILKPINEDQLEAVLIEAIEKLQKQDHEKQDIMDKSLRFAKFAEGRLSQEEQKELLIQSGLPQAAGYYLTADLKFQMRQDMKIFELEDFIRQYFGGSPVLTCCLAENEVLLILAQRQDDSYSKGINNIKELQDLMESKLESLCFITISKQVLELNALSDACKEAKKLQKYLMIEGYGNCIDSMYIENRSHKNVSVNKELFHKLFLAKDIHGISSYLEDLFIGHAKEEAISIDVVYQMAARISLIYQEIMEEFKLDTLLRSKNMTDYMERLKEAEELSVVKMMFISDAVEIINMLHTEESQYTPVVRQIISEVQMHYEQNMNLKTLAYKYNINTSYLGQIFQKEVGLSFSQYLTNMKNEKARELILNTNKKINDIAKQVGYTDTSYFYRKFKQCYGVSPATLRELKQY